MNILGKPLFYLPDLSAQELILSEEESRHCVSSLRQREGELIFITDGKGNLIQAEIIKANPKAAHLKVVSREKVSPKNGYRRLVIAPPKTGERLDWLVEKAVEIGVDEMVFIETRYSERDKMNLDRMQKIAVSAMKQSKQLYLPHLSEMIKWKQFLSQEVQGRKFIAHIPDSTHSIPLFSSVCKSEGSSNQNGPNEMTILIGPEGDFSSEEVKESMERGFEPISLGPTVLRTETAAIYSLVCINAFV